MSALFCACLLVLCAMYVSGLCLNLDSWQLKKGRELKGLYLTDSLTRALRALLLLTAFLQ